MKISTLTALTVVLSLLAASVAQAGFGQLGRQLAQRRGGQRRR